MKSDYKPFPSLPGGAKEVPGFDGYFVTENAVVYTTRLNTIRILKPARRKEDGRARYTLLGSDGTYRRLYASHVMLIAYVGPRPMGMEACHGDGDCLNDSRSNLRWDTPVANKADMLRHGTRQMGENHPKTKLTNEQIQEVLKLRSEGQKLRVIADQFGVTETRVYQIVKKGAR